MNDVNRINSTLSGISKALDVFVRQSEDCGLLSGYCGSALFYAYYYKLTARKKHLNTLNRIIQKTSAALAEKEIMYSHCSGISGMIWGLQHLVKQGFIEEDEAGNIFEEVDAFLFKTMQKELSSCRYDFLHEGLGIMLYFLDRLPDQKAQAYLKEAVRLLEKVVITKADGICWRDYSPAKMGGKNKAPVYNLGLSHGVPGILSILSMVYEKGIEVNRVLPLIENGVKWLLHNKNKASDNCVSLYPGTVSDDEDATTKYSRLAWCYSDLSVAITLLNIGNRLKNERYLQEGTMVFEHSLRHRDIKNGLIADASLCHGSTGVSHIYRRAYEITGNELFLKEADLWLQHSLQMASWSDGLAGFKYATPQGYENNYNLLEGITGIGLGLMAAVDSHTTPAWDRCLLLS